MTRTPVQKIKRSQLITNPTIDLENFQTTSSGFQPVNSSVKSETNCLLQETTIQEIKNENILLEKEPVSTKKLIPVIRFKSL